jgi:predicted ABC-type ATPase
MKSNKKLPLFVITGTSGVGKSTLLKVLFEKENKKYIALEGDLLWNEIYDTPDDGYISYRKLWLNMCSNITQQIDMPVVLCGCNVLPEQFEKLAERQAFSEIHYMALVCDEETLASRINARIKDGGTIHDIPYIHDEGWIKSWIKGSAEDNKWLISNAETTTPKIRLLDTTKMTPEEAASIVDKWILEQIV